MLIPWSSLWRGTAAYFDQPVYYVDDLAAQCLMHQVAEHNTHEIVYRSSSGEDDIRNHVFRWDSTPYQEVFQNGFRARHQMDTADDIFFNLDHYVHHGGRPLDSTRPATHAFISTTLNSSWVPLVEPNTSREVWRYEIYAPGGIWVFETLGADYRYESQDEVTFVAGIARQYIRSAQLFRVTTDNSGRRARSTRVNDVLWFNTNYNPQSHPPRHINIRYPVFDYFDQQIGRKRLLKLRLYPPPPPPPRDDTKLLQEEPQGGEGVLLPSSAGSNNDASSTIDWYARDVADIDIYISAAFRSSSENEAYIFMYNEYVKVKYTPGNTTDEALLYGPSLICHGFPSLIGTAFAEHGIDCAFRSSNKAEAFISSGNLCAMFKYAPASSDDKISRGPMTIAKMFPFFKGTEFEGGIDAAFESTNPYEAYLFKGYQYANVYYGSNPHLIGVISPIVAGFPCLKDTIFHSGMDAAFASHLESEAYLFKGESYARMHFTPGFTNDYLIGGVKEIIPYWPSLGNVLPRKNRGLDVHNHTRPDPGRDQDEL